MGRECGSALPSLWIGHSVSVLELRVRVGVRVRVRVRVKGRDLLVHVF
jgi:hypothetical protein